MERISVKIMSKNGNIPAYETEGSAGMDIRVSLETDIILKPMERVLVPTGLHIELTKGYEAQIRARSGLAIKNGISLVNGIGTIDSDYRGEIKIALINLGNEDFLIRDGDRIAQMIIAKYEQVEWKVTDSIGETKRASGGFGHTGV